MTGGKDEQKEEEGKGFAGLSSLVSDVDTTPPPPIPKKEPAVAEPSAGRPTTEAAQPKPRPRQPYQPPEQSSAGSSGGKWLLGMGLAVGALWLIGQINRPSSSLSAYTPAAQAPSYQTPGTPAPPSPPQVPSAPEEVLPPVGSDMVLSTAQIRYCLAEDIRMDAVKAVVDNYDSSAVDRFNMMVNDYNSRCGSFRYRSGALETARRDVEPYRSQLMEEGRSRLIGNRQSQLSSQNEGDRWGQDPVIEQQKQSTELRPITDDFTETAETRQSASAPQTAPPLAVSAAEEGDPIRSSVPEARETGLPANAYVLGSNWYCKEGFRKVGNECEALVVPQNGYVLGSNWYCKEGFRKVGNECEALVVPQNGYVLGSNWYCKEGFRKVGNECEALVVPQNGYVLGSNWYCKEGFRKVGNECAPVFQQ